MKLFLNKVMPPPPAEGEPKPVVTHPAYDMYLIEDDESMYLWQISGHYAYNLQRRAIMPTVSDFDNSAEIPEEDLAKFFLNIKNTPYHHLIEPSTKIDREIYEDVWTLRYIKRGVFDPDREEPAQINV